MTDQDNEEKNVACPELSEKDRKRLIELLDELVQIFSSNRSSEKIEVVKDIRRELCDIKKKYE